MTTTKLHTRVSPATNEERKLSAPSNGRSLGATIDIYGKQIKNAVSILAKADSKNGFGLYKILASKTSPHASNEDLNVRAAWFLINVCLVRAFFESSKELPKINEAINWFFSGSDYAPVKTWDISSEKAIQKAEKELTSIRPSLGLSSLLPYILEPHGHVTRGELEKTSHGKATRERKRKSGVFYTPADVANFMVRELAINTDPQHTWIDPACGTGVFLREVLSLFYENESYKATALNGIDFCTKHLFGLDLSVLATESCAFVLLVECARNKDLPNHTPYKSWLRILDNLKVVNSLEVEVTPSENKPTLTLNHIFSQIADGFDHVIMNPPYSKLPTTSAHKNNWHSFSSTSEGSFAHSTLAFIEMMSKFSKDGGTSASVVPLSVGFSTVNQFKKCREYMLISGGRWEFLFFDREPHALFGEDIKTRNTIIFHARVRAKPEVRTSGLLKWTSKTRPSIFTKERLIALPESQIIEFVPKLSTRSEASNFYQLINNNHQTGNLDFRTRKIALTDIINGEKAKELYIGSTAYNFINCFFALPKRHLKPHPLSSSPAIALSFDTKKNALIAFSIFTSRLIFWLWHVQGDGFHVTNTFLKNNPLTNLPFSGEDLKALSEAGLALWETAYENPVSSINGGKLTYSFHCPYSHPAAHLVEGILLRVSGIPEKFTLCLDNFIQSAVHIDGKNRRICL